MNQAKEDTNYEEVYSMGITGRGVDVTVLDTGIYLHEDSKDRVTAFADFVNHRTSPYDDNGHGTHIAAMIGDSDISSDGEYRGVAPGCSLISVKVPDQEGNGYTTDVLTGLKWIRENRNRHSVRIMDISVGSLSRRDMTESPILVRGVNTAWDDDLVVVVAAGNCGPGRMTITTPGISHKVIAVDCSDDHKEVDIIGSRMMDCSGGGPTLACVCEPDSVAPNSYIIGCRNEPGKYFLESGTSMSTPLVSGAIALLLEKYPGMSNRDVRLRIRERALDLGLPHNQQRWGKLDVGRLLGQNYKQCRSPGRQRNKSVLPMQYLRESCIGSLLYGQGKLVIANVDSYTNAAPGHFVLKQLYENVKEEIIRAGGAPIEFSTVAPVPCWRLLIP